MKKFLLLCAVLACVCALPSMASAADGHLVINQIQVSGDNGANDEFVEIYNPTDHDISLAGWSLQYKSSSGGFPLTSGKKNFDAVTVPAGGYYLVSGSAYNGSVAADLTQSTISLSGASAGATIFLVNSTSFLLSGTDGTIVDKVAYGTGIGNSPETAAAAVPDSEQAIVRSSGIDTDNNSVDFIVVPAAPHNLAASPAPALTPTPAPDPTPTPAPPPASSDSTVPGYSSAITISEFLPNPDGTDSGEEWIELYNSGDSPVDLSGWKLDDESSSGAIGSSAYTFPTGSGVSAHQYFVVDLPEGSFALNNTGGDSVRLIWPDKTVIATVTYTGNAKDDITYARRDDGAYAWTTVATKGSTNVFAQTVDPVAVNQNLPDAGDYANTGIKFNELFPNPAGPDSGSEWVEVKNTGTQTWTLHNWILDDGEKDAPIGSSAYVIQSPTVKPGEVAVIAIPAGKFAMNNSGPETVRLFSPDKKLVDWVTYSGAKEGLSYSLESDNSWSWGTPTPNEENLQTAENLVLNEIFPYPVKGSEEYIEILNASDQDVNLAGFKIKSNSDSFVIGDSTLAAGQFLVLKRSVTGLALANTAKEQLELISVAGVVVSSVEYEDAPKNQSFSRNDDGDYVWTASLTPGAANKFTKGTVAGQTLVRTGNPNPSNDPTFTYFAIFIAIWYIAYKLRFESSNSAE